MGATRSEKEVYFTKLRALIEQYPSIFLCNIDNVSSQQIHKIRQSLRGKGVVLMGKNTMVRRALRTILADFPQFEKLLPHVKGNIGFVFTSGDLKDVREIIVSNVVAAPAKAGAVATVDVFVPAGNTGMEPGKTSFFQALGIPTKIARGTIEIVNDVQVVSVGNKVGTSEATLLNMLNISPFTYGMSVVQVYDNGAVFPPSILDIEESTLIAGFTSGVKAIAAISLAIGIPTIASVMHSLVNSYKNLLYVSLATDYEFEGSAKVSILIPSSANVTDQGVPCQPRGFRRRCPCCRRRVFFRRCPRRRGEEGRGGGGFRRRHGFRTLRLDVLSGRNWDAKLGGEAFTLYRWYDTHALLSPARASRPVD